MAYAIFDRDKLKSMRSVAGAGRHTDRLQPTPNAQPGIENRELIPTEGKSLEQLVSDRLEGVWRRKDSVLCVELFLSASPEYFRPDDDREYGTFQPDRLEAWIDKNLEWLRDEFGEKNIVKASLHLDEATPHVHAYFVPVVPDPKNPGREKLNCKKFFGGPSYVMAEWQTKYAEAMAPLGLQRGEPRGEKSQQIDALTMKELYREIGKVGQIKEREQAVGEKENQIELEQQQNNSDRQQIDDDQALMENWANDLAKREKKLTHKANEIAQKQAAIQALQEELEQQRKEAREKEEKAEALLSEARTRTIALSLEQLKKAGKKTLPEPYWWGTDPSNGNQLLLFGRERAVVGVGSDRIWKSGVIKDMDVTAITSHAEKELAIKVEPQKTKTRRKDKGGLER